MIIRAAQPGDEYAVAAMVNQLIRDTTITFNPTEKTVEQVATMIAPPAPCLVLEDANGVSGYAHFFPFRSGAGYDRTVEHSIVLAPDTQGQGHGRALLEALCALAKDIGKHQMIAGVSGENEAGLAFHARLGFDRVGQLPGIGQKFGRPLDLILMQKRL